MQLHHVILRTLRRWTRRERRGALMLATVFARAATISEDFSTDPLAHGWKMFGDANLFHWNATNQNLEATWDSSRTNGFFAIPLSTIMAKSDDFSVSFDVRFSDIAGGVNPSKPSTFPLCVGFQNWSNAIGTNFFRGTGHNSPNLAEFAYFPDTGYGPTIWPSVWFTNSQLSYYGAGDYTILALPIGVWLHVNMRFTASNQTVATTITTNGISIGAIHDVKLYPTNRDFRVDTFAIESFSDAGQDPQYGGSLIAHGIIDNITLTVPLPPVQNLRGIFTGTNWQVQFTARTNWIYTAERTVDLQSWTNASSPTSGVNGLLLLSGTNSPTNRMFYRIRSNHL